MSDKPDLKEVEKFNKDQLKKKQKQKRRILFQPKKLLLKRRENPLGNDLLKILCILCRLCIVYL